MNTILSVVSKPGHPDLEVASKRLQASGFALTRQLVKGRSLELTGSNNTTKIANLLENLTVDWCFHPGPVSVCQVLLCDMDSTIIGQECVDELADLAGVGPQVKQITNAAMQGKLDFAQSLHARVQLLAGQSEDILEQCWQTHIRLNPGAKTLIATLHQRGVKTALVSGGFTWFANRIAKQTGFSEAHANQLEIKNGKITGQISGPILDGQAKRDHLLRLSPDPSKTCAIGDGANDALMVKTAGIGIAYRAKPILEQAANGRIQHTDLTTALLFQGIPLTDWVD